MTGQTRKEEEPSTQLTSEFTEFARGVLTQAQEKADSRDSTHIEPKDLWYALRLQNTGSSAYNVLKHLGLKTNDSQTNNGQQEARSKHVLQFSDASLQILQSAITISKEGPQGELAGTADLLLALARFYQNDRTFPLTQELAERGISLSRLEDAVKAAFHPD